MVDEHPLPWLAPLLNGVEHANFFETRATEYSKAATRGDWNTVWDSFDRRQKAKAEAAANDARPARRRRRAGYVRGGWGGGGIGLAPLPFSGRGVGERGLIPNRCSVPISGCEAVILAMPVQISRVRSKAVVRGKSSASIRMEKLRHPINVIDLAREQDVTCIAQRDQPSVEHPMYRAGSAIPFVTASGPPASTLMI